MGLVTIVLLHSYFTSAYRHLILLLTCPHLTVQLCVVPCTVGVQGVEYSILDGRVVDGQLRMDQHQIVTEQSKDGRRQCPHLQKQQQKHLQPAQIEQ